MSPLYGLILVGGRNRRMGMNKEKLKIAPKQVEMREYFHALLTSLLGTCVFSINRERQLDPYYGDKLHVVDIMEDRGPLCGLLSAMKFFPGCSFLALACDMPFVDATLIHRLMANRGKEGVFYELNSRIEPLCGIYESILYHTILNAWETDRLSLRAVLEQANINRIKIDTEESFLNINTRDEFEKLQIKGECNGQKNDV